MEDNEFDLEEHVRNNSKGGKPPKEILHDNPDPEKDKTPPPGWKKSLNPFADNTFIPPGWKKVGDTYTGPGE